MFGKDYSFDINADLGTLEQIMTEAKRLVTVTHAMEMARVRDLLIGFRSEFYKGFDLELKVAVDFMYREGLQLSRLDDIAGVVNVLKNPALIGRSLIFKVNYPFFQLLYIDAIDLITDCYSYI